MLVFAGPGGGHSHDHGHTHEKKLISKKEIKQNARLHVNRLIEKKKIDVSWKISKLADTQKKKFKSKMEWVVTFKNKNGVKGKKLYIFLSLSGRFIAANFTGK
jgi:hypothetical protein